MLQYILFDTTIFGPGDNTARARKDITWILEALTQRNQTYLRQHPSTPRLYKSGVHYQVPLQFDGEVKEVKILRDALGAAAKRRDVSKTLDLIQQVLGGERFRDIGRILENGGGDCFPLLQKIIARSRSTGQYELLSLGELRHVYLSYEALSYNFRTCKYEFKAIVGFVDKGRKAVSRAHLSNGTELVATDDHKFWSIEGTGANSRRLGTRTMGEYVEAYAEFKKGRMSRSMRGVRSRIVQAAHIPALSIVRPSQAEAYLAGIYAAEGEFDGKHTRIGQHKMAVREKIEEALAEVGTSFHYQPGRGRTPGSGAQYSLHGGAANSLVAMMRRQGEDSFSKRVPQAFLSADEQTVTRLLEGHGDGDAWRPANGAYKRPNVEAIYVTSSDELMEQLRLGLLITGRSAYAYRYEDHGGEGTQPIWRLHEYNDNASKLEARREQVGDDLPGLTYGTVRYAVSDGEAHVGCIEVEDNHNFFLADGTLASNCDNLACWRAAELREAGIQARPCMTHRTTMMGNTIYHALVLWPPMEGVAVDSSGQPQPTSEDPSLLLGMSQPERAADRAEEIRKNQERCEILQQRGGRLAQSPTNGVNLSIDDALSEVLGTRRRAPDADAARAVADVERLLKGAA